MNRVAPELRMLGPADAEVLAGLERDVFADAWTGEQFSVLLEESRFVAAGALEGTRLAAYVTAYNLNGELEIVNVAVLPHKRGQGLGTAVLRFFLDWAVAHGADRVVLEVRSGNVPARRLYAGCGFRQAGLRRGYYSDTGEDALILEWLSVES